MRGCFDLRHEIRAFVFQIMHRASHQCHRLAHSVANLRESLSRLFLSGNLRHHLRRLGLHDGTGEHMTNVVVDFPCYASTFRKRGRTYRGGAILLAFRQLRAQPTYLVASGILESLVLPCKFDVAGA